MVADCTIVDSYLSDDLIKPEVSSAKETIEDWFDGRVSNISIDNKLLPFSQPKEHWTPTLLSANSNIQKISNRGVYNKNSIGINDYVTFNPNFRNFGHSDGYMSICWRLNSYEFPFTVTEGLMYWSRKLVDKSEERFFSWENLATHIPFYTSDGDGPFIKLPEDRVLSSTSNTPIIENSAVKEASEVLGLKYNEKSYKLYLNETTTELWIPDGDVFSYTENQAVGLTDKSFISPALYKSYNAIYNAITYDLKKLVLGDADYRRRLKNLSKYLASSPLVSNFHIEALRLDSIKSIKNNFLNGDTNLKTALSYISAELNSASLNTDLNLNQDTGTQNENPLPTRGILRTPGQVFNKLFNKYGAKLALRDGGTVNLGSFDIKNGDNIAITQVSDLVTSDVSSLGPTVTATQEFETKNIKILSKINNNNPEFNPYAELNIVSKVKGDKTSENRIPLYDGIEPYWGPRLNINIAMAYDNTTDSGAVTDGIPRDAPWSVLSNVFTFIPPPTASQNPSFPDRVLPGESSIDKDPAFPQVLSSDDPRPAEEIKAPIITLSAFFPILSQEVMVGREDWTFFLASNEALGDFGVLWEHVSGPEIKFTDTNISGTGERTLYNTSTADIVDILPSDYGAITVKCTISGPFGVHVKYKTFIVETEKNETATYSYDDYMNRTREIVNSNVLINKYNKFFRAQRNPIALNPRGIKVVAGSMTKVAFKAEGAVWPVSTNFKVVESAFLSSTVMQLSGSKFIFNAIDETDGGKVLINTGETSGSLYSVKYNMNNSNIRVYVDRIIVEKVRNGSTECSDCLSLFSNTISAYERRAAGEGVTGNTLGYTNNYLGFALAALPDERQTKTFGLTTFSTDRGSPLRSYGGYNSLDSEQKTNFHNELELPDVALGLDITYPPITGYPLDDLSELAKSTDANNNIGENGAQIQEDEEESANIPRHKLCYPKASDAIIDSVDSRDFYVNFKKGSFIPNSGWVDGIDINKSSVLKFNPGARDSFTFNGPKLNIDSSSIINLGGVTYNSPKIFTSTVSLGIAKGVQWDPLCECPPAQGGGAAGKSFNKKMKFQNTVNQLHKEYADAYNANKKVMTSGSEIQYESTHGYRMLAGGHPKQMERTLSLNYDVNDEFFITTKENSSLDYETLYEFGVTGPANNLKDLSSELEELIRKGGLPEDDMDSDLELRDPRVNSFQIKDLEVNLRFFNYVNTQDLVIWLEAELSEKEIDAQKGRGKRELQYPDLINVDEPFLDQVFSSSTQYQSTDIKWSNTDSNIKKQLEDYFSNTGIKETIEGHVDVELLKSYLTELTTINSTAPQKPFKLMLLNQEYVKNNEFNLSLKFSDNAETNNSADGRFDTRYTAVDNFSSLKPTTAAMGFSSEDHHLMDKIIPRNGLTIPCNTFSKFHNKILFVNPAPETGPCKDQMPKQQGDSFDSQTKFSLKIAVVNETDLMGPYDNVKSNVLYNNFTHPSSKVTSTQKFSTLCTWETILHVDSETKPVPTSNDSEHYGSGSDILGFIDYQTQPINKDSGYYGNSFIADLTGMLELMPLANVNAPFQYIQDFTPCPNNTDNPFKTDIAIAGPPEFPSSATASILAAGAAGAGLGFAGAGAAAAGASIAGSASNSAYGQIFDYFSQTRKWRGADRKQGEIYALNHDGYQFGSGDKILLNVSKDGAFWYNLEASIFRLSNTPRIKTMLRDITPISNGSTDLEILLSNFEYSIVSSKSELYEPGSETIDLLNSNIGSAYHIFDDDTYDGLGNRCNITVIKIENSIPYDLYDVDEEMNIVDSTGDFEETTATILGKAKIILDNKHVSIFALSDEKEGSFCPAQGDTLVGRNKVMSLDNSVIAIIDPVTSIADTLEEEENIGSDPTSQFKFDGDINDSSYDDQWSSAKHPIYPPKQNLFSRGSYGDISLLHNKFFVNELDKVNKIKKLYEIYNNRDNNKFKYNKILLYDKNTSSFSDFIKSKTRGFSCSINELLNFQEVFDDREEEKKKRVIDSDIVTPDTLAEIKETFQNKYKDYKYKNKKHEIIYIKNQNFNDIYEEDLWSDYQLMFQGDMTVSNKVNLYGNTKNDITKRLETLDGEVDESIIPEKLSMEEIRKFFKLEPSISTALLYYDNSKDSDEVNALIKLSDNIEKLCAEGNSLKRLLLQIAEEDVTSHVVASLSVIDNNINTYDVDYSINNNLYWINIDPKQSCSIAEELRPKVLIKTVTSCAFLDPNLQGQEGQIDNNVCPQFAYGGGFSAGDEGVEQLEFGDNPIGSVDFRQTLSPTYTIPEETVQKQKEELEKKYPSIAGWATYDVFRTFYMPTTQDIGSNASQNYIVLVREYYEVALPASNILPPKKAIEEGLVGNDYSADVNSVSGIGNDPACTDGSPGGLGLLSALDPEDDGLRVGAPSRVTNIFNLDNTKDLRVKFRKIPRSLRGVDLLATLYRYGDVTEYRQDSRVAPLQPIQTTIAQGYLYNFPYMWQCYEFDEDSNLQKTSNTRLMQLLNELSYRAYMGSVDGAENREQGQIVSEFDAFMIPHEYTGD